MTIRNLIKQLGGPQKVAVELNLTAKAVSMWGARDSVPARHWIDIWRLANRAGVNWTPPGAEKSLTIARAA